MSETKTQHWRRRGRELSKMTKAQLCVLYRQLGGLGGMHPPEKWRKGEVITSITEMEWDRLPADQKLPDPPCLTPPCDVCGKGTNATVHRAGGDHNWRNTYDPDQQWVPESEAEEQRISQLADSPTEEQPHGADATVLLAACTPNSLPDAEGRTEHGYQINVLDDGMTILATINLPDWETFRPASAGHRLIEHGYRLAPEARGPEVNGWTRAGSGYMAPVIRS